MASKKPYFPIGKGAVIPALILFWVSFLLIYRTPLEIFPKNNTYFGYTAESDGNFEGGNSSVSVDTTGKHLQFAYTLGDSSEMPFARLVFHAHQLFRTLNLNHYRTIDIVLHPEETNSFVLTIFTYIPGFSDPDDSQTHRPYSLICHPIKGQKRYRYSLKDFATPSAWFSAVNVKLEDAPRSDWAQMTHLSISDATLETGVPLKITLEKIRFVNSVSLSIVQSLIFPLLYIFGFLLVSNAARKKRNRDIKQRLYHPGSRESYSPEEKLTLLEFLSINFRDPLLTLEKIEKQTQLNQFQVSEIISDTFKMRYKQYVNYIRLEEAKKLLLETDTPINAIAEKVGYCYSNSFSRAFRLSEGVTPNEYRKVKQSRTNG